MRKIYLILFFCSSHLAFSQNNTARVEYLNSSKETGTSKAVIVGDAPLAHTIQILPLNQAGAVIGKNSPENQLKQIFKNLALVLKESKSEISDIIKVNAYIRNAEVMPAVQKQIGKQFAAKSKPAVSFVVGDLPHPDALVTIDVVAVSGLPAGNRVEYQSSKSLYSSAQATHVAVLPVGPVVYVSGQADKGNMAEATRGTLKQLETTLEHLGISKDQVVQIKAFVQPMSDFKIAEKEIAQSFAGRKMPPIVYSEWTSKDPIIEIELIAASPKISSMPSQQLDFITPPFLAASPVYSRVVRINFGRKIYTSGLYGSSALNGKAEVAEIFSKLQDILQKSGSNFTSLVKATYYVANNESSTALNQIRPKYYDPKRPPAASKAAVKGVGLSDKTITIDMISVAP